MHIPSNVWATRQPNCIPIQSGDSPLRNRARILVAAVAALIIFCSIHQKATAQTVTRDPNAISLLQQCSVATGGANLTVSLRLEGTIAYAAGSDTQQPFVFERQGLAATRFTVSTTSGSVVHVLNGGHAQVTLANGRRVRKAGCVRAICVATVCAGFTLRMAIAGGVVLSSISRTVGIRRISDRSHQGHGRRRRSGWQSRSDRNFVVAGGYLPRCHHPFAPPLDSPRLWDNGHSEFDLHRYLLLWIRAVSGHILCYPNRRVCERSSQSNGRHQFGCGQSFAFAV